ncbi:MULTISPECIES: UTP--glucose-1-phosphate uridylyltransferase [unclassified Roseitalea]|uniref:UTP--glucose-1-phosphate uridylyltransferase n=1 Tax=unclassified Roseitalea TaxID=2639107 RepID=UPI00273DF67D|nr:MULTISPECIES: UTP--glucose-1-phosphate uridylyltransferase [unclassified Roseitalea]
MTQTIRKAVIPVAGLGTRFLPATKAVPKEMLTVVDKPVVQYAVEEAQAAGIEHIIFVTGRNKHVIEDHFDHQFELETTLEQRGKTEALAGLRADLPQAGQVSYTRQQQALGLGHAVWCARALIDRSEPFAVLLPDMVMTGDPGCLSQMVAVHEKRGGNIVSVEACAPEEAHKYGIVSMGETHEDGSFEITGMVEKPEKGTAPSNYFMNGRYILDAAIMDLLGRHQTGAGGEIQLTDSMLDLMAQQPFHGVPFEGETYDCGSKLGFLSANIALGLANDTLGPELRAFIKSLDVCE